jgi:hypothetical protein
VRAAYSSDRRQIELFRPPKALNSKDDSKQSLEKSKNRKEEIKIHRGEEWFAKALGNRTDLENSHQSATRDGDKPAAKLAKGKQRRKTQRERMAFRTRKAEK